MRKWKSAVIPSLIVIIIFLLGAVIILNGQASATKNAMSKIDDSESSKINKNFINAFFNYSSQSMRYKQVEKFMTPQGFHDTFPSGTDIPKEGTNKLGSSINKITSYENVISKTELRYLSEIDTNTIFNGVSSRSELLIKSTLVFIEGEGWKVDGLELVSEMSR